MSKLVKILVVRSQFLLFFNSKFIENGFSGQNVSVFVYKKNNRPNDNNQFLIDIRLTSLKRPTAS